MPSLDLTGAQRKRLRGLAHHLKPLVAVGRQGVTEAVRAELDHALASHELVKVRVGGGGDMAKAEKRELLEELASGVNAGVAGLIGHTGVLYRPAEEENERKVRL